MLQVQSSILCLGLIFFFFFFGGGGLTKHHSVCVREWDTCEVHGVDVMHAFLTLQLRRCWVGLARHIMIKQEDLNTQVIGILNQKIWRVNGQD